MRPLQSIGDFVPLRPMTALLSRGLPFKERFPSMCWGLQLLTTLEEPSALHLLCISADSCHQTATDN